MEVHKDFTSIFQKHIYNFHCSLLEEAQLVVWNGN